MKHSRIRPLIALLTATALVNAALAPSAPAWALSKTEIEACAAHNEEAFRAAVEGLTRKALTSGLAGVDYRLLTAEAWRRGGLDQTIDREIDGAVERTKAETSYLERWKTLADKEKAQELAVAVSEKVFKAEAFRKGLETLAADVSRDIGKRIETGTGDAAEPAAQCMRAFLGPRYGSVVARAVGDDTHKEFAIDPRKSGAQISAGSVLIEGKEGIAGAIVLLVRRQLSNMAARIGQRVVGAVLGRLVSLITGPLGVLLIAKDIWDFRHGVLPIIETELKSRGTKDRVQEEVAKAISEQVGENIKEISAKTAERVLEVWHEFRRVHAKVIELADRHTSFKSLLDTLRPGDMPRLNEAVGFVLAAEGEDGVLKRVNDGSLQRAVTLLPQAAFDIARDMRSLEAAFRWQALAGGVIGKVHEFGIHRATAPGEFTRATLDKLIALDDRTAIGRLLTLKAWEREPLLELQAAELKKLARALEPQGLAALAQYQTGIDKAAAQRILRAVAEDPRRMLALSKGYVRQSIVASRDQSAAVNMMLRQGDDFDLAVLQEDVRLAYDGRISPILLWEKHMVPVLVAALASLVLLLMIKRILFGGRRRPATAVAPPRRRE